MTVVMNWVGAISTICRTKGIGTFFSIIAAGFLGYKSLWYVRAFWKRFTTVLRIQKICREKGYTIEKISSVYPSVFRQTDIPEMLIRTPEESYIVKFFTCVKKTKTYILSDLTNFSVQSNAKPVLVDQRYPADGRNSFKSNSSNFKWIMMPQNAKNDSRLISAPKKSAPEILFPNDENVTRIFCINPISVEMQKVITNKLESIFDGDYFCGCRIYSGSGLCDILKEQ